MNRAELQTLTEERLRDVEALIQGQRWSFAYYVAGYAVECALKSCVLARMIHTGWVFQEKAKIAECMTHDFEELIRISGLKALLDERLAHDARIAGRFDANWGTVKRWKAHARYVPKTESEAIALRDAITGQQDGILPWIMNFW